MEDNEEPTVIPTKNGKICIPVRFVFVLVTVLGQLVSGIMSMCMSMAIVGMVKTNETETQNDSISDAWPVSSSNDVPISSRLSAASEEVGEFDWDSLTQSYILAASSYGSIVSIIIGARIGDLVGPKLTFLILNAVGGLLSILVPVIARWSVEALIVLQVLQGVISGPTYPIQNTMISTWIPVQERTQMASIVTAAQPLSAVLAMILTGKLIAEVSWEFIFYLYGGMVLLWCLLWAFLVYDSPHTHPRISESEKEYILANTHKETKIVLPAPWLKMITSLPVWSYLIFTFRNSWTISLILSEIPTYLKTVLNYDLENTGYLSSLPHIFSWLGYLLSGFLSQWMRTKYFTQITTYRIFNAIETIGPAIAFIVIGQVGCDSVFIVCLLMIAMFLNSAHIGGSMLNHMDLAVNFTGPLNGFSITSATVASIITPSFSAAITNNNNTVKGWSIVFYISAGLSVFPYIFFLVFGSVKEQEWNRPSNKLVDIEQGGEQSSQQQDEQKTP